MKDEVLRAALLQLLDGGNAHATVDQALRGLAAEDAFKRPPVSSQDGAQLRSAWELLEHMRIAQEDIVDYTVEDGYRSPPWPEGYWPALPSESTPPGELERLWKTTLDGFRGDLERVRAWVRDTNLDLTDEIAHGEGRTYLRQVLLVADHNAYHLGQIVTVRRVLGNWG